MRQRSMLGPQSIDGRALESGRTVQSPEVLENAECAILARPMFVDGNANSPPPPQTPRRDVGAVDQALEFLVGHFLIDHLVASVGCES